MRITIRRKWWVGDRWEAGLVALLYLGNRHQVNAEMVGWKLMSLQAPEVQGGRRSSQAGRCASLKHTEGKFKAIGIVRRCRRSRPLKPVSAPIFDHRQRLHWS